MAAVLVEDATSGMLSGAARRSALFAFIAFLSFTLAGVSVTLFNRPKLLVPPVAQDESGAIACGGGDAGALASPDGRDDEKPRGTSVPHKPGDGDLKGTGPGRSRSRSARCA